MNWTQVTIEIPEEERAKAREIVLKRALEYIVRKEMEEQHIHNTDPRS